jgi:hypothetical protein
LNDGEMLLKRKLRQYREVELDLQREDLNIQAANISAEHRALELQQKSNQEEFQERQFVEELAVLQREIARQTAEFDEMLMAQTVSEEPPALSIPHQNPKHWSRVLKRKRARNIAIFSMIRSEREKQDYLEQEIRSVQAKLHLEQYHFQKLSHEKAQAKPPVLTEAVVVLLENRVADIKQKVESRKPRVARKYDLLARVEKVHSGENDFVIADREHAVDLTDLRTLRLQQSAERIHRAELVLRGFVEFGQAVQSELRKWKEPCDPSANLDDWLQVMGNVCRSFRSFGI